MQMTSRYSVIQVMGNDEDEKTFHADLSQTHRWQLTVNVGKWEVEFLGGINKKTRYQMKKSMAGDGRNTKKKRIWIYE